MKRALIILLLFIFVAGCAPQQQETPREPQKEAPQGPAESDLAAQCPGFNFPPDCSTVPDQQGREMCERCKPYSKEQTRQPTPEKEQWREQGAAIPGAFADADIVEADGKYRMYYSPEPETQGFQGQVYSAISTDGKVWTAEEGTRRTWSTFPSVIRTVDGKYRMYLQNAGVINSASSQDGLTWTDDQGTRIDKSNNAGLTLENVAAPTVIKDGSTYIMVYRGTINEKYPEDVPNSNTQLLLWATSSDGLTFEKKGLAIDSRNAIFKGLLDGPELVDWDGKIRLYFWSYKGVYHSDYKDGKFSEAEFDFSTEPGKEFPMNPPGDPTLAKINGKWHMYYGQHSRGIYHAVLE